VSEFRLYKDNWDKKGLKGVDIFDKNLDSCKFISDTVLQNTASSTANFFSKYGVLPCYSTQGSVQPLETGELYNKPDCSELS